MLNLSKTYYKFCKSLASVVVAAGYHVADVVAPLFGASNLTRMELRESRDSCIQKCKECLIEGIKATTGEKLYEMGAKVVSAVVSAITKDNDSSPAPSSPSPSRRS